MSRSLNVLICRSQNINDFQNVETKKDKNDFQNVETQKDKIIMHMRPINSPEVAATTSAGATKKALGMALLGQLRSWAACAERRWS